MGLLNNIEVGNRLKIIRLNMNLSPSSFANNAGIDVSQYSKIEKGSLPITKNILEKLIKTYSLDGEFIKHGINVPRATQAEDSGEPGPGENAPPTSYLKKRQDIKNESKKYRVPFYDAEAVAYYYLTKKDIYSVMRQLRHRDLNTTMIYLKSLGLIKNDVFKEATAA